MRRVSVVCLGNICRSPMAEVVLREMVVTAGIEDVRVDSAGTGAWHIGEPADRRASDALRRRGYPTGGHRARQFTRADLVECALVLALDRQNLRDLERLAGGPDPDRIRLLGSFAPPPHAGRDVPDPYYGDAGSFDEALDLILAACAGVVAHLAPG